MHHSDYDTRLAAYAVIIDEDDRILLSWYNGLEPQWTLPGGGVEFEETPEQGVVREVHEETGYDVELGPVLSVTTSTRPRSLGSSRAIPFKAVRVLYSTRITGGTLGTIEVGGTTDRAEWFAIADLAAAGPRSAFVDHGIAALRG